jgi:hypothetical protein|eukprot:COSAG06_NODE_3489_length_5271_cov_95.864269_3_plen_58_part_00
MRDACRHDDGSIMMMAFDAVLLPERAEPEPEPARCDVLTESIMLYCACINTVSTLYI